MSELPVFPLWVTKYEGNTAHLSLEEDGAYMRLLRLCWKTPGGTIPADDAWVMRQMRCDAETFGRVVKPILGEFFKVLRGRYVNPKLKEIFDETSLKTERRKIAGKKGGTAKAQKSKEMAASIATALPEQNASNPEPEPEPLSSSSSDAAPERKTGWRGHPWSARIFEVAGPGLADPDKNPSILLDLSGRLSAWQMAGWDLELDVIPVIEAKTAKPRAKGPMTTFRFLEEDIAHYRAQRLKPAPIVEINNERTGQGQSGARTGHAQQDRYPRPGNQSRSGSLAPGLALLQSRAEAEDDLSERSEDWRVVGVA